MMDIPPTPISIWTESPIDFGQIRVFSKHHPSAPTTHPRILLSEWLFQKGLHNAHSVFTRQHVPLMYSNRHI